MKLIEMIKIPIVILFSVLMLGMPSVYDQAFAGGPSNPIDIVFVIDNSGSMADDIAEVKTQISGFDATLMAANVDPLYGLVSVSGGATFLQDLTDFTTFTAAGSPFQLLTANGPNPESGSLGITIAMNQMNFRGNGVPICIILITDEDDDSDGQSNFLSFSELNRPVAWDALQLMLATNPQTVLTIIADLDFGNTPDSYVQLATMTGGLQEEIADFRQDSDPVLAAIVSKIIEQALPVGGEILSINTTALLIAGIQANLAWMIVPALLATGTGVVLLRKRLNII